MPDQFGVILALLERILPLEQLHVHHVQLGHIHLVE
jgi:hypothetical protein